MSSQNEDPTKQALAGFARLTEATSTREGLYGAYADALELVRALEDRLSTRRNVPLKRFFVVPTYLWLRGLEQIAIGYGRTYMVAFALGLAGLFFSGFLPQDLRSNAEVATFALNMFAAFSLVFAAPSTYCSAGTNEKHVETVSTKFYEWNISSSVRIELILKNIRIFEERVKRRLAIFRWFLGVGWAVFFSPLLTEVGKSWAVAGAAVPITQLTALFVPLAWLISFYVLVEAYARGVDVLFRCLELGCHERIARLDHEKRLQEKYPDQQPTL
jgi:hypothetical protein